MAGAIRQPIDIQALERYINANVPEVKTPVQVNQFGFGQSNPTYQLTSPDGTKCVLRKKPPGALVSATAHKVEREARVISALSKSSITSLASSAGTAAPAAIVPVPKVYVLCQDSSIIGTPFYIMSFLDGRIFEDATMPDVRDAAERTALWKAAVQTLALLHRVDVDAAGLSGFGRREGFYARQIERWRGICQAQQEIEDVETGEKVGPLPRMDNLMAFFADEKRRPGERVGVVHGDFKIDNLVFHKTEPRVIGIIDWEMSTIGHPLSDLSNLLMQFFTCRLTNAPNSNPGFMPGKTPGLPTPDQIYSWYSAATGWSYGESELAWSMIFTLFKLAAVCQGIAARVARRQASSAQARETSAKRGVLSEFAWSLALESKESKEDKQGKTKL